MGTGRLHLSHSGPFIVIVLLVRHVQLQHATFPIERTIIRSPTTAVISFLPEELRRNFDQPARLNRSHFVAVFASREDQLPVDAPLGIPAKEC